MHSRKWMQFVGGLTLWMLLLTQAAFAEGGDPWGPDCDNPNVVACYPDGTHAIVGEHELHEGSDVVMRSGSSDVFHQWFEGTSPSEGEHRVYTVWKPSKDKGCDHKWMYVQEPYPEWGDYFPPGQDSCARNNVTHDRD